jgi:hypothetical protein
MNWQGLVAELLVLACSLYAVWQLMPATLRRRAQARLRGQPMAPGAASACGGCSGCGDGGPPPARREAVIRIVRQPGAGASADDGTAPRP